LRVHHRAELEQEPERYAALVLRSKRTAGIAQRPFLLGEDFREAAHEHDVKRCRVAGQLIRQDGDGMRVCFDQLRQRRLLLPAHIISAYSYFNRNPIQAQRRE